MYDLVVAGGWMMAPILVCSMGAAAVCIERWWSLRRQQVLPADLLVSLQHPDRWPKTTINLQTLAANSALGYVVAMGLSRITLQPDEFREHVQDALEQATHDLERYLTGLGIVASICPLLGILGTVVGLIDVFDTLFAVGQTNTQLLAGGISTALITSAAGLSVAIPALVMHRIFLRHIDSLAIEIEEETKKFFARVRSDGTYQ